MTDLLSKAVVTGASGFIGQALVCSLKERQVSVVPMIKPDDERVFHDSIEADIMQKGVLDPYLDATTTLFHLAARTSVAGSVESPRPDFDTNVCGFFEVLESARKSGCRLVFPSTASVYDPENPLPLKEKSFMRPSSPYGAGKIACEAYAAAYHRCYGLDVRMARLFSAYGEGMKQFVIHDLFQKLKSNPKTITLMGDGEQIRDYLHIDDVVRGLILIATEGSAGEDYNLASGIPTRIHDLAKMIATLSNHPHAVIQTTGVFQPGEVKKWYADISKIEALGFKLQVPLKEGVERTIAWLTQHA